MPDAASTHSVLGRDRGHPLLVIRAPSLTMFCMLVLTGNSSVVMVMLTRGLAMALVVSLRLYAWRKDQPDVALVLGAIIVSVLAAGLKASGAHFTMGGLAFNPNFLYHLAQMPALLMLLVAVQRQADGTDRPLVSATVRMAVST